MSEVFNNNNEGIDPKVYEQQPAQDYASNLAKNKLDLQAIASRWIEIRKGELDLLQTNRHDGITEKYTILQGELPIAGRITDFLSGGQSLKALSNAGQKGAHKLDEAQEWINKARRDGDFTQLDQKKNDIAGQRISLKRALNKFASSRAGLPERFIDLERDLKIMDARLAQLQKVRGTDAKAKLRVSLDQPLKGSQFIIKAALLYDLHIMGRTDARDIVAFNEEVSREAIYVGLRGDGLSHRKAKRELDKITQTLASDELFQSAKQKFRNAYPSMLEKALGSERAGAWSKERAAVSTRRHDLIHLRQLGVDYRYAAVQAVEEGDSKRVAEVREALQERSIEQQLVAVSATQILSGELVQLTLDETINTQHVILKAIVDKVGTDASVDLRRQIIELDRSTDHIALFKLIGRTAGKEARTNVSTALLQPKFLRRLAQRYADGKQMLIDTMDDTGKAQIRAIYEAFADPALRRWHLYNAVNTVENAEEVIGENLTYTTHPQLRGPYAKKMAALHTLWRTGKLTCSHLMQFYLTTLGNEQFVRRLGKKQVQPEVIRFNKLLGEIGALLIRKEHPEQADRLIALFKMQIRTDDPSHNVTALPQFLRQEIPEDLAQQVISSELAIAGVQKGWWGKLDFSATDNRWFQMQRQLAYNSDLLGELFNNKSPRDYGQENYTLAEINRLKGNVRSGEVEMLSKSEANRHLRKVIDPTSKVPLALQATMAALDTISQIERATNRTAGSRLNTLQEFGEAALPALLTPVGLSLEQVDQVSKIIGPALEPVIKAVTDELRAVLNAPKSPEQLREAAQKRVDEVLESEAVLLNSFRPVANSELENALIKETANAVESFESSLRKAAEQLDGPLTEDILLNRARSVSNVYLSDQGMTYLAALVTYTQRYDEFLPNLSKQEQAAAVTPVQRLPRHLLLLKELQKSLAKLNLKVVELQSALDAVDGALKTANQK
jgi:hypothetical protein